MATINKALTTYLPPQSVEWLEEYCLDNKQLQNKEGNPKLGTAIADIIARLSGGELSLPATIEQSSTVPNTLKYDTEINELKSEVDELKKLVDKVLYRTIPSTVPDYIGLTDVRLEIEKALEPINEAIEAIKSDMVHSNYTEIQADSIDPHHLDAITQTVTLLAAPIEYIEPGWYSVRYSKFFHRLTTDEGLLESVTPIFNTFKGSKQLGVELLRIGFMKGDGTPLEVSTISELRRVVNYLNVGN